MEVILKFPKDFNEKYCLAYTCSFYPTFIKRNIKGNG